MGGEEVATDTVYMPPTSKFDEFCIRRGINPNLIMLKITLFVMYGATSSLLPYLTIHMQSIGLTVEEIAIIYLALPFTTFLSPPITGFLVDKFGKYKPVVVMSLLLNAIFHHSLLFIPQQEIPGVVPSAFVMRHPDSGDIEVWWSPCPSRECPEEPELELAVNQCVDYCLLQESATTTTTASTLFSPSTEYYAVTDKIAIQKTQPTTTTSKPFLATSAVALPSSSPASAAEFPTSTTISQPLGIADGAATQTPTATTTRSIFQDVLNMSATMFPPVVTSLSSMSMLEQQDWNLESLDMENITAATTYSWVHSNASDSTYFMLQMHPDLADPIEQLGMEIEQDDNETVTDFKQRFGEKRLWEMQINVTDLEELDLRCGGIARRHNMSRVSNETVTCMVQRCTFTLNAPEICPPDYKETDDTIFWIYFMLRFLATTMLSAGVTIMDPIALTMIEKYGGDFGRERLFSSIGMAIFSPITGIMIDYFSRGLGYTDYSAAFYTYDILLIISTVSVLMMPLGEKLPADNVFRDLWNLLKMPHVITFIFFLFILGNFWGFIESFLFLYLKELGAPNYLLGITITVGTVSSIPFLYGAEKITRIFGHVNLIIIAFFSHAGRLVGYSFIENAWWCFPFEAMEALSCHLMWVAAATYCSILAPKSLLATLIGVLGMAHFSLGRGSGSFSGGLLIGQFGTRDAFRYMGLLAVVGGIAYGLLHLVWLRKFDHNMDDLEEEVEAVETGETEKLTEPATKEQGTSMSLERLSLMIKYNQIGSLSSLPRGSRGDIHDHLSIRRSSYNVESLRSPKHGIGSASKVDILRSALEINHKSSNNSVLSKTDNRTSNQSLGRNRADSAPKLNHTTMKNISQPALEAVVLEGVESTFFPSRMKKYPSGLLTSIPAVDLSVIPSSMLMDPDQVRIPEETELNNSKLTVNSANGNSTGTDENSTKQANGNGKSIQDERKDKDDAT
ncbi:Major facilitator superfamily domain-containing protein 6 [Lucilia cuprina]|nr:Major facilitator superfamily domain-containing protein 6 [Lucilia cuprina]KAI8118631.1 Major facilitator superfamily domain-containing protein 6 [Lucilia cuprina]